MWVSATRFIDEGEFTTCCKRLTCSRRPAIPSDTTGLSSSESEDDSSMMSVITLIFCRLRVLSATAALPVRGETRRNGVFAFRLLVFSVPSVAFLRVALLASILSSQRKLLFTQRKPQNQKRADHVHENNSILGHVATVHPSRAKYSVRVYTISDSENVYSHCQSWAWAFYSFDHGHCQAP